MGLDIHCGDQTLRCGYHYVQTFREKMIYSSIQYLKSQHFNSVSKYNEQWKDYWYDSPLNENRGEVEYEQQIEEDKEKLIQALKLSICGSSSYISNIDYRMWIQNKISSDRLSFFGLIGLKWIVDHSDVDGFYTPGQCLDILNLFARVEPNVELTNEMDKIWFKEFTLILMTSVDKRKNVLFR